MKKSLFILLVFLTFAEAKSQTKNDDKIPGLGVYLGTTDLMTSKTISLWEVRGRTISMAWDASVPKSEKFEVLSYSIVFTIGTKSFTMNGTGASFTEEINDIILNMSPKACNCKCYIMMKNVRYKKPNGKIASITKTNLLEVIEK